MRETVLGNEKKNRTQQWIAPYCKTVGTVADCPCTTRPQGYDRHSHGERFNGGWRLNLRENEATCDCICSSFNWGSSIDCCLEESWRVFKCYRVETVVKYSLQIVEVQPYTLTTITDQRARSEGLTVPIASFLFNTMVEKQTKRADTAK